MDFDLTDAQIEQENGIGQGMQVDEEMIEVPPAEASSLFSVCVPQNSYYFQNVRQIDNQHAFIKRSKCFQMYEQGKEGSTQVGATQLYHVKISMLPGKGEFIVVGGAEDAECTKLSDKVQLVNAQGKFTEKKPICSKRAKIGLTVGELRSEVNA